MLKSWFCMHKHKTSRLFFFFYCFVFYFYQKQCKRNISVCIFFTGCVNGQRKYIIYRLSLQSPKLTWSHVMLGSCMHLYAKITILSVWHTKKKVTWYTLIHFHLSFWWYLNEVYYLSNLICQKSDLLNND